MRMRTTAGLLALTIGLGLAGCASAAQNFINSTPIGTARAAVSGASMVSAFAEVRSTPSPVGGTYRVTTTLPDGEDVVFYARTTDKPTAPFMQGSGGASGLAGHQEAVAYLLIAQAAPDTADLVTNLDSIPEEPEEMTGSGMLYVTIEPKVAGDGTKIYDGTMVLELAPGHGEVSDRYHEAFEAYQERVETEEVEREALSGGFRMAPDGSLTYGGQLNVEGEPYFIVHAERISDQRITN